MIISGNMKNNENFVEYIIKQLQITHYIVNNFLKMNTVG